MHQVVGQKRQWNNLNKYSVGTIFLINNGAESISTDQRNHLLETPLSSGSISTVQTRSGSRKEETMKQPGEILGDNNFLNTGPESISADQRNRLLETPCLKRSIVTSQAKVGR